jgi:hypothetical protein
MHIIFKITLLKHNHSSKTLECLCPCATLHHSSKTLECLCPCATLHVSVINLDHPQGYCSCCNATVRLLSSSQLYLGMWLCFCLCCCRVYPPAASPVIYCLLVTLKDSIQQDCCLCHNFIWACGCVFCCVAVVCTLLLLVLLYTVF